MFAVPLEVSNSVSEKKICASCDQCGFKYSVSFWLSVYSSRPLYRPQIWLPRMTFLSWAYTISASKNAPSTSTRLEATPRTPGLVDGVGNEVANAASTDSHISDGDRDRTI